MDIRPAVPVDRRNVSLRGLDKAADAAGLSGGGRPRLTMHDCRHSFAAHLIVDLGMDAVRVSRMLGHSKPSISLDVYADLFEKRHADRTREPMRGSKLAAALVE
jgi:integrase